MAIINGYSYGQIVITSTGDVPGTQTINLPLTNRGGGLEETTILRGFRKEGIGTDPDAPQIVQVQRAQGFDIIWNFHYEEWITGDDLLAKFLPVLRAWKNGSLMKLVPRVDVPERYYYVKLMNETLTMRVVKASQKCKYHRGVLFTFQTTDMQSDLNWLPTPQPSDPVVIAALNEFNYNA